MKNNVNISFKETGYLVRPDDSMIWEIDPLNGCYRGYEEKEIENRHHAYEHFTYEDLTKNYGWFPIEKEEISKYLEKMHFHYGFISWQHRNDGHGDAKGGTMGEYIEYLERVKRWKLYKEKEAMELTNKLAMLFIISHSGKWGIYKRSGKKSIRNFKHRELAFHYAATNYGGVKISVHNKDGSVDFIYN